MPTSSERLAILIEANTRSYENAMKRIEQKTNQAIRASEKSVKRLDTSLKSSASSAVVFARSFVGAFATIQTAQALGRAADSFTRIENALKVAGLQGEALKRTLSDLEAVAKRQSAPIEDVVKLYSRMATVQKDLGVTSDDMLAVTEGVAAALKIQGTSAQEASGSLTQLAQAFGGGIVRAEEFNSVLEGTPALAQAIANNIDAAGGSIGKLRQLVVDGKITSEAFFKAIQKGSGDLKTTASTMDQTLGQAVTNVGTAFILAVGEANNLTGASGKLVAALEAVAAALRNIGDIGASAAAHIKEMHEWLTAVGLLDPSQHGMSLSDPQFQTFLDKSNQAKLSQLNKDVSAAKDALRQSEEQLVVTRAAAQQGLLVNLTAAELEVESLRSEFEALREELAKVHAAMTGLSAIRYDPLSSVRVPTVAEVAAAGRAVAAPSTSTGVAPITNARQFVGLEENRDADILSNLFKQAGQNIDPKMVAWCAAFVNAALATSGLPGTGSNMARSFLDYGEKTETPQVGDIVVLKRGGSETQGHVGFFEGQDAQGNVRVLGGNQSDGVNVKSFAPSEVIGYRKIPGAGEASASGNPIEEEIARRSEATKTALEDQRQAQEELSQAKADFEALLKEEAAAIDLEIASMGKSSAEQERMAVKQDLTNQLTAAGIPITEEYAAAIDDLANRAAGRVTAQERFDEEEQAAQDATQLAIDRADSIRDLGADVIGGLANDLANGVKPAEALANALQKVAEKLLDIGINALTNSLFGPQGTALGGIFGSLFGGGVAPTVPATVAHSGGVMGSIGTSRSVPASMFAGAPRYHSGGTAGLSPGEMPAILKKGEGVFTPQQMAALGGGNRSLGKMRSLARQRVDVDNVVRLEPSAMFEAKVRSEVRQGQADTLAAVPDMLKDQQRRVR